jgi:hypothetical protein
MRLAKKLYARNGWKLEFTAESFNLFNRVNRRFQLTQDGLMSNAARLIAALSTLESTTSLHITKSRRTSCAQPTPMHHANFSLPCAWDSEQRSQRKIVGRNSI